MADSVPRIAQIHGDGRVPGYPRATYEVEYEHEVHEEAEFPEEDRRHGRQIRVALAAAAGTPAAAAARARTIEETLREEVANTIDSTKIIIVSFFANFVYDIIVNGIGTSNIVFALFLVVAFIIWLWIAAYIRNVFVTKLKNSVLRDFMSFIDNSFIMLVVRYGLGVIDALYISSTTSVWIGILVVFAALALVYIVVYAFGRRRAED